MPNGLVMEGPGKNGWHGDFPILNWTPDLLKEVEEAVDPFAFNCNEYANNEQGYNALQEEYSLASTTLAKYTAAVKGWFEQRGLVEGQDELGPDVEGIEIFSELKEAESKALQRKQAIEECLFGDTFAKYANMG